MIKINLLDSITDTPRGAAMVEEKVTTPRIQTILLALTVVALLVLGMFYDYASANSAHAAADAELKKQQEINRQMLAVNKEQEELQAKTRDIQTRIDAIQKLKASQQGPGSVLREITDRFNSVPGLYLKSITQKGSEVTIKGESPNEAAVTRFGQTLEFSSGLFTDLHIETLRENAKLAGTKDGEVAATDDSLPKPEVVTFMVKCNFGGAVKKDQPTQPAPGSPVSQPASQVAAQVTTKN